MIIVKASRPAPEVAEELLELFGASLLVCVSFRADIVLLISRLTLDVCLSELNTIARSFSRLAQALAFLLKLAFGTAFRVFAHSLVC